MNELTDNEVVAIMNVVHYLARGLRATISTGVATEDVGSMLAEIEEFFPLLRDRKPMSFAQVRTAAKTVRATLAVPSFEPVWQACIVFASPEELKETLTAALHKLETSVPVGIGAAGGVC